MKRLGFVFLFLVVLQSGSGQISQPGVQFQQINFKQALKKAQKENKVIFLQLYSAWCGICQQMAAEVFPDQGLGKYYNDHFINVKILIYSPEGKKLADKYRAFGTPTFAYIRPDGSLQSVIYGYYSIKDLEKAGEAVVAGKQLVPEPSK